MGLRFAALFLILLLLFEPIWRQFDQDSRPPVLAVLVDDSQSLSLASETEGHKLDLAEATRQALRSAPLDALGGDAYIFAFNANTQRLPGGPRAADSLRFEGPRTNISQALEHVHETLQDANLRGVLLISDGQYNTGRNPLYQAERFPVPINTVVVGDTTRRRDVQIRRITTNEIAYVDAELPIQVGIRAEGYEGEQVIVALTQDGQVQGSETIRLPSGTAEVPVDLKFTPTQEGYQQLGVSVTRLEGEVTYRNNYEAVTVRVLENRRRVLVLGAAPSPDLAAVRQLLQLDPNTEIEAFVQKGPRTFYEGLFPTNLDAYDVMVLVGFPGRGANPQAIERVAAAATAGTPLLFLLTRQTDLNLYNQYLADVVPVQPSRRRPGFAEASFSATPRGSQHPILSQEDYADVLGRLPPLLYNESRWQASPDARILATIDVRGIALDDPLLVIRQRSKNRSAALLGAGTWRWKNLPEDLDRLTSFWPGLFSNIMQWLSTPDDDRRVRVVPVEQSFGGGETVSFSGQVYDESLNPIDNASLTIEVTAPDNTQYPYTMEPVGSGRYVLDVGTLPEGTYRYSAEATRDDMPIGTDQGTFTVGALTLEFKETRANVALMRQIAQRSGGTFFAAGELDRLPQVLQASGTFSPLVFEETRETELWHIAWFLAAIITLLTLEWFFRKRSGMV